MNSNSFGWIVGLLGFSLFFLRKALDVSERVQGCMATGQQSVCRFLDCHGSLAGLVPGFCVLVFRKVHPAGPGPSQTFLLSWTISTLAGAIDLNSEHILHRAFELTACPPLAEKPLWWGLFSSYRDPREGTNWLSAQWCSVFLQVALSYAAIGTCCFSSYSL